MDSIKIEEAGVFPTGIYTELQDGQVICDLYEQEDIPLTLSVDNFTNVAEKVQSYSKSFNLPATKRNNLIFDNVFEVTRTSTGLNFNPYLKTKCVLKQDGYILFDGYLRLIGIKNQNGEISYDVNLYSEVVALADTLKELKFSDIDFSELSHDYNKTNIKYSWYNTHGLELITPLPSTSSYAYSSAIGNLTHTNVLKYPFVDWTGNIGIYTGSGSPNTNMPELPNLESAFRPFIQIRYLINKIFELTPFTWSSDFFNTSDFRDLFMDFNWGAGNAPALTGGGTTPYEAYWIGGGGQGYDNIATTAYTSLDVYVPIPLVGGSVPPNYDITDDIITATQANEMYDITFVYTIERYATGTFTVECRWLHTDGTTGAETEYEYSGVQTMSTGGGNYIYTGTFNITLQATDTLQPQFKASHATSIMQHNGNLFNIGSLLEITTSTSSTVTAGVLNILRGELNQWDFLKGIMTMFNLISMPDPDNPNNIIFEPYKNIFISNTNSGNTSDLSLATRSIEHDWTEKIDVSQMQFSPLTDLNKKTIFKYVEDEDDHAFKIYKNANSGYLYGSLEYDATGFTILDGEEEIVAEPFAATVIKPLYTQFSNFIVPAIYASNEGAYEEYENVPRIVSIETRKQLSGGVTYFIPAQNGLSNENQDHFLQCGHLTEIPTDQSTTLDINFGVCQLFQPLMPVLNNLYQIYWAPYYNELYNADTRTMTLKVNLTPADINTFQFTDRVMIKNQVFRVNKIDYKPNALAKVEFILIP